MATKAVAIYESLGFSCCLFGSAGCALYGTSRTPNVRGPSVVLVRRAHAMVLPQDVDIVVMTSEYDTEYLKRLLTTHASTTFYLRPSKAPGATYKVLFARLGTKYSRRSCKVDILIPGILDIPHVDRHRIVRVNDLPVIPLIVLLLLKLKGWSDHRASSRSDFQQKQYVDVRDINQLLMIVADKGEDVRTATWLPQAFVDAGQERLNRYITALRPLSAYLWGDIGFKVAI